MRTRTAQLFILSVASVAMITSCKNKSSFQTDPTTGVQYRFINHDEKGTLAKDDDYGKIVMLWTGKNAAGTGDSTYIDSRKNNKDSTGAIMIPLKKSFNGCLEQGIQMMAKGDSAVFLIDADSLFIKTFHQDPTKVPAGFKASKQFTFQIKLVDIMSQKDIADQRNKMMQQRMQQMQIMKAKEPSDIADYLKKNNYTNVKPDKDSIFLLKQDRSKGGKAIMEGDSVEVNYKGMLLDGTVFDGSDLGPGHQNLKTVYSSKHPSVIIGWIKVLSTMHQGDKVTVLIPSNLGYGPRGNQGIPPFAPLVFDMHVISVKSNK